MTRFVVSLIAILLIFAACSRSGDPIFLSPRNDIDPVPDAYEASGTTHEVDSSSDGVAAFEVWGVVDMVWDPLSGDISVAGRSGEVALKHYRVSSFLVAPYCSNCITVEKVSSDPSLGTGVFDVTLINPTKLCGYDVRGVLQVRDGVDLRLLNPDGYTSLFQIAGYKYPAPFVTYAGALPDHSFAAGTLHTQSFEVKTNEPEFPVNFKFLVTAGYPGAPGDACRISEFMQAGQLLNGGGSALISFNIEDLQNDITGVCLRAAQLGAGDVWLAQSSGRWEATLMNYSASPGMYELKVDAYSPNQQSAVTSHYYRAIIFHDFASFRTQLLSLVNSDRASDGQAPLAIDAGLNTVAQAHAQDMSDQQYFNHINLDGWTPWRRMDYYGVSYKSAGENIAVGYDTPSEVETAWMNSSGHRANILNSSFGKIGIGIVPTQAGDPYSPGYYWVQAFTN